MSGRMGPERVPGSVGDASTYDASSRAVRGARLPARGRTAGPRYAVPRARHAVSARPSAVLVGLDTALVHSREARILSWLVALHDNGHDVSLDMLGALVGRTGAEVLAATARVPSSSPDGERILCRREEIFRVWYLPRLRAARGGRALLLRMKRDGLRLIGVALGTYREARDLAQAGRAADLLDAVIAAASDYPGAALAAVVRSLASTNRPGPIMLLGGSPHDVDAALATDVGIVGVESGGWSRQELRDALAVYRDPLDLVARYRGSPFASHARDAAMRSALPSGR